MRIALIVALALPMALPMTWPLAAHAQGTVAGQGFGYPAGQYGARSAGTGGALAPFDAISPVNPATIAEWQRGVLYFHIEPEYRSTSVTGSSASTRISRFPLAGGASRVARNGVVALTFTSYLDRTWETVSTTQATVGNDQVDISTRYSSLGAINDLRLATGWQLNPRLRVGAAYHAYTGANRLAIGWDFADSTPFGDVTQESRLAYSGRGVSGGAEWTVAGTGALAAYARWGGRARLRITDTLVAEASMPSHLGLAARNDGIAGTIVALGWERIGWSAMQGLGSPGLVVRDADRLSIGAETRGPEFGSDIMHIRLGLSRRGLPFDALGARVTETAVSMGAGFKVAQNRANIDVALQRAMRSAGSVRERAWLFTFGLAISP